MKYARRNPLKAMMLMMSERRNWLQQWKTTRTLYPVVEIWKYFTSSWIADNLVTMYLRQLPYSVKNKLPVLEQLISYYYSNAWCGMWDENRKEDVPRRPQRFEKLFEIDSFRTPADIPVMMMSSIRGSGIHRVSSNNYRIRIRSSACWLYTL